MEIKEWQWVRFKNGYFYQHREDDTYGTVDENEIIATADDPRELVQVGDLVQTNIGVQQGVYQVISISPELDGIRINTFHSKYVRTIWTPNSKGDYIKQWESEENG